MPPTSESRSPLHATAVPQADADEDAARRHLALCDRSTLPKLGVKGSGAEAWLRSQGIDVPPAIYDVRRLGSGDLFVRLGTADFFMEAGDSGSMLPRLSAELATFPAQVHAVQRQDATILLMGQRATEVLAQLCSIDFPMAPVGRVCLTRVAGVNCMVLPEPTGDMPLFRLWVDYTFAVSFWETLTEVAGELGGRVVK